MGQTITKISPPEEGYETYTAYRGNVGEPEWQCQASSEFYGSFSALPWHCQRATLEKFEPIPYEPAKESPTKIPHPRRPQIEPPAEQAGLNKLMKYTISATNKRINGEEDDEDDEPIRINTWTFKFDERFTAEYSGDDAEVKSEKKLNEAMKEVDKRLENKKCLDALGGEKKVKAALKKLRFKITDKGFVSPNAVAQVKGNTVQIRKSGPFFDDRTSIILLPDGTKTEGRLDNSGGTLQGASGDIFANDMVYRAFVLLHEIGHLTGASKPDYVQSGKKQTEEDKKKTIALQIKNNDNILNNCFTQSILVFSATTMTTIE